MKIRGVVHGTVLFGARFAFPKMNPTRNGTKQRVAENDLKMRRSEIRVAPIETTRDLGGIKVDL